jgi:hypothetical protein
MSASYGFVRIVRSPCCPGIALSWEPSHECGRAGQRALGGRIQGVIATSSASFSDGFMYPRDLRGRPLCKAAILARSLAL